MLIITIHNDRTAFDEALGNYDYEIRATSNLGETERLAKGRIERFERREGYAKLMQLVAEKELAK